MIVSPSLLSADFANLAPDIEMINNSEADYLHLDVMDGVFVPNISFGFPVMNAVAKVCKKPLDVHLMIVEPQNWISQVRDTGAEFMCFHQEACTHIHRTVQAIRQAGMRPGISICPATPVALLEDIIEDVDQVLIMSVNPGFGGQKFIESSLKKVRQLRQMIHSCGSKAIIEVDGGVNDQTGPLLAEAGADMVVAGNYVFKSPDPLAAIRLLRSL